MRTLLVRTHRSPRGSVRDVRVSHTVSRSDRQISHPKGVYYWRTIPRPRPSKNHTLRVYITGRARTDRSRSPSTDTAYRLEATVRFPTATGVPPRRDSRLRTIRDSVASRRRSESRGFGFGDPTTGCVRAVYADTACRLQNESGYCGRRDRVVVRFLASLRGERVEAAHRRSQSSALAAPTASRSAESTDRTPSPRS